MDELEGKLVYNESLVEKTKIFRNESITYIEDLSNEIFYEIFDYFDGGEIVKTFFNLNSRFEQLLHSSPLSIKTHFYLFHYQEMMNTFNELDILPTKICSNLKILSVTCSKNIIFLDAYQWERLILQYYPQLEKFYFTYYDHLDNDSQYPIYTERSKQFSSSFWIERKWIFGVKIDGTEIKYTIHPYSKRWYDNTKDNVVNRSVEHFTFPDLTLECVLDFIFEGEMEKQIERILRITQIYHLEIHEKNFTIHLLIETVNLLPEITTLKIHSLSTEETIKISVREVSTLCSIEARSKITKLYLEEFGDGQELDFLFIICPHIEYFKVGYINTMDVQSFLRNIFKKINNYGNHHLGLLCFNVQTIDDRMVKDIQEMIKCEKLLHYFTVKRILDTVYLQCK